jgi:hypothetical protein
MITKGERERVRNTPRYRQTERQREYIIELRGRKSVRETTKRKNEIERQTQKEKQTQSLGDRGKIKE